MASLISSPLSSVLVPPPQNTNNNGADRPSPFHPSVWGDFFISYNEDHKQNRQCGRLLLPWFCNNEHRRPPLFLFLIVSNACKTGPPVISTGSLPKSNELNSSLMVAINWSRP
ncbi:hypothetical protein MRB53_010668 [Persea americana]|uniref:Uncharacterized protein n=1 Tax=Persea americana TaxID=3435 RepID=A0ACC2LSD9_PERAE|nr:hypothetical protein MRB53_010668 [Persea americana]